MGSHESRAAQISENAADGGIKFRFKVQSRDRSERVEPGTLNFERLNECRRSRLKRFAFFFIDYLSAFEGRQELLRVVDHLAVSMGSDNLLV